MGSNGARIRAASPAHLAEPGGERAVDTAALREHPKAAGVEHARGNRSLRRRLELPVTALREKAFDLRVVLLGLERAGAVDEQPAESDHSRCGAQNAALQRGHHRA